MPANPSRWSTLHDLGLIYLALTHGADASLAASEQNAMARKLAEWGRGIEADPERVDDVMDEVMLVYMSDRSEKMLESAVMSVEQSMPKPLRIAVLNELAELASADGSVVRTLATFSALVNVSMTKFRTSG